MDYEYDELRAIAYKVSSEAAALLRDNLCDPSMAEKVRGETTRADKASEEYIVEALMREGLDATIVSEEMGIRRGSNLVALVDPLDGSINYVNCIPWASVSIAFGLASNDEGEGSIVAGSVAPIFNEAPLSFALGKGCYKGAVRVEEPFKSGSEIIAIYVDNKDVAELLSRASFLQEYKLRSLGSASLELSYVGLGLIDAFLDLRARLRNIDVAAAHGIVKECGGKVVDHEGREITVPLMPVKKLGKIIASRNEALLRKILSSLS